MLSKHLLTGSDAVICLNGAPIGRWPWTEPYKRQLALSRLTSVNTFVSTINSMDRKLRPRHFVSGSAVGFYGSRGNEVLTEFAAPGSDFLSALCWHWESAAKRANVQTVTCLRTELVIHNSGGLLKKLHPLFRFGLGSQLGDGNQWMPTISLSDHVSVLSFTLSRGLPGAFNLSAPSPIQNRDFSQIFAARFGPWQAPGIPEFILRSVGGGMAALALNSQRAVPSKLLRAGFRFSHPTFSERLDASSIPV